MVARDYRNGEVGSDGCYAMRCWSEAGDAHTTGSQLLAPPRELSHPGSRMRLLRPITHSSTASQYISTFCRALRETLLRALRESRSISRIWKLRRDVQLPG